MSVSALKRLSQRSRHSPLSITMAAPPGCSNARRRPSSCGSTNFSNLVSLTGKIFAGRYVLSSGGASIGSSVADGAIVDYRRCAGVREVVDRQKTMRSRRSYSVDGLGSWTTLADCWCALDWVVADGSWWLDFRRAASFLTPNASEATRLIRGQIKVGPRCWMR